MSVYFITCREASAVKIGHSVDPHGRLPEIQLGCPLPLKMEAWVPGNREEEKSMHWRFSEHRIHGEWFRLCEDIELIISANPAPPRPERGPKGGEPGRTITPLKDEAARRRVLRVRPLGGSSHDRGALKARVSAGDIHFPFREMETA